MVYPILFLVCCPILFLTQPNTMMQKLVVLLAVVVCVLGTKLNLAAPAINDDIIHAVNNDPSSTWIAGRNERLEGLSLKDFSRLMGVKKSTQRNLKVPVQTAINDNIPATFDARTNWPGCIGPVLDQGHCASCWAFGAVESLSDRFCIQSKGAINVSLSEQMLVSCDNVGTCQGGGDIIEAWGSLAQYGTVTSECYPYVMGSCTHPACKYWPTPACETTCQNGQPFKKYLYHAKNSYYINNEVAAMQTEIMNNGPIEVTYTVYEDFANYKSGVYIHKSGAEIGIHAVKAIGWGTLNGVDYWLIQNSWNATWGMKGFFMIQRGTDQCGIEDTPVAGLAKITSTTTTTGN